MGRPLPPFDALYGAVGPAVPGTTKSRTKIKNDTIALAQHSPVTFALFYGDAIHICHLLTKYPGDLINATTIDGHAIVMIGNDTNASVPMVRDNLAFQSANVQAKSITLIRGATGHGAIPPVLKTAPHIRERNF